MHIKYYLLGITLFIRLNALTQKQTTLEYIEKWKDEAIFQMEMHKIPASITLAQGILESGNGNSMLAKKAKNHFGIKCHSSWTGKKVYKDDDKKNECFRKYNNANESFTDHSDFLKKKRYAFLFNLKVTDYKGWAKGLKKAGYATNPKYPKLLIGLVERYNLDKYDSKKSVTIKEPIKEKEAIESSEEEIYDQTIVLNNKHIIEKSNNNVKYIVAKKGDSFTKLANEFDMRLWQLHKYNDFSKKHVLQAGERVYIKPKRCKAKKEFHVFQNGETMHSISQQYGIKLKKLYKKNKMIVGSEPKIGKKLYLRKNIKN